MFKLVELPIVKEEEHLVPNLPMLVKGVFGNTAIFLDWKKSQYDWITGERKHPDGLVWLPWRAQLWLIEVEWKEGSNFFNQARAFANGKIDTRI